MSSEMDLDSDEPPVKKERLEDELAMVNYEMEIEIANAGDGEIDPLMPIDTNDGPAENSKLTSLVDFVQPIKIEEETPDEGEKIYQVQSAAVGSDFELPGCEIPRPILIEDELVGKSEDIDVTSEVKSEIDISDTDDAVKSSVDFDETSAVVSDCDAQLVISKKGPEIQLVDRSQQLTDQYASILKSQLSKPSMRELDAVNTRLAENQLQNIRGPYRKRSPSPFVSLAAVKESIANSQQALVQSTLQATAANEVAPSSELEPPNDPMPVAKLLENPFTSGSWTENQKNEIIKLSRPKPDMRCLKGLSAKRIYEEIPWICGSSELQKFYCWPCLLCFYSSSYTQLVWSAPAAFALDQEFNPLWTAHEESESHLAAEKVIKNRLRKMKLPSEKALNPSVRMRNINNAIVRRNRRPFALLVQTICYLKKENHNAAIEDYVECVDFVLKSNWDLRDTLKDFSFDCKKFVTHYSYPAEKAVMKALKAEISEEVKRARFVTLFMEDLSCIVDNSSLIVVAHFVDQRGDVQERIVEVDDIGHDRSAAAAFMVFQRVVFQYNLRLKVAGFTYSATLVRPSDAKAFNERVERLCPMAKFFHYQGHNLTGMLFQALSHIDSNCRDFVRSMNFLQNFFKKHLLSTLQNFERLSGPQSEMAHSSNDFGFVTTLKRNYSSVLETFASILAKPDEWDGAISSEAPIYMGILQDNLTRFLVVLVSHLNLALVEVTVALQKKIDDTLWKILIRQAIGNFITIKNFGFNDIYATSLSPILVKESRAVAPDPPTNFTTTFNDVIDTAIAFLHQRFDTSDFGYIDLETVAAKYYARVRLKPQDVPKFRLQIQLLAKEPTMKGKTLAESLKYFYDYNLALAVPEYATFLNFAMTIPSSRSSLHCPVVERVLQLHKDGKRISSKNTIWLEKELLADVLKNKKFCDTVINIVAGDFKLTRLIYEKSEEPTADS